MKAEKTRKPKPVAVLIADVHYNINTLPLADAAMRQAIDRANIHNVPLIVAGDLHDTKAMMRGECINAMIETFNRTTTQVYIIVGNHCKINEKSDGHSLNFLKQTGYEDSVERHVVDEPIYVSGIGTLIPYYSSAEALKKVLARQTKGSTLIMHQGVLGAHMGHYIQDKTSLPPEAFADFRVLSGHYHRRQDIQCGPDLPCNVGTFSYIGNPYTLSFGEALDPPKGFQVLMDDGSLEFYPTDLRKHVIVECTYDKVDYELDGKLPKPEDLYWVKITGPVSELRKIKKDYLAGQYFGHSGFKLDLIPSDSEELKETTKPLQDHEILDNLIEALPDNEEHKHYLKALWRELME